jgi:single-stranded DNA-binding protein
VIVVGDLSENTWDTPEGERRSRIEMRVDAAGWDFRYGVPGAPAQ